MDDKLISEKIGVRFKEIRKELDKKMTLKKLSEQVVITSPAALSRWENGKQGIPVEVFDRILKVMNLSYDEVIIDEKQLKVIQRKVDYLYQINDTSKLKELSSKLLKKYYAEKDELNKSDLLIQSAIAANYYLDLTGKDLTNNEFKNELTHRFAKISQWLEKDVELYDNVQLMLEPTTLYELSCSLIKKASLEKFVSEVISVGLLNSIFVLIKTQNINYAQDLLNSVKDLRFANHDTLVRNRIQLMDNLITYIKTNDEDEFNAFLKEIKESLNSQLEPDFRFAFNQIKEIYNK